MHKTQDEIDLEYIAEAGMSPIGFKNPGKIMKERSSSRKNRIMKKNYTLYGDAAFQQNKNKVEADRQKLKRIMEG